MGPDGHRCRRGFLIGGGCVLATAAGPAARPARAASGQSAYAYLGGRVDEGLPPRLMRLLQAAVTEGVSRLTLVINTQGGDVSSGLAAHEILVAAPLDVATYNVGSVGSIGVFVYLAGRARLVHPRASFLLHGIDAGARVSRQDEDLRDVSYRRELAIIRERTLIAEAEFHEIMRGYRIYGAGEALAAGLATEVAALGFPYGNRFLE